jgi:branched-chain amino acid transport system ATP-binding protein
VNSAVGLEGTSPGSSKGDAGAAPVLELQDVKCAYGGVQAVNGVSMKVAPGAFIGLIGPNGAGKTTLLDCVSGFNRSYSGKVFLNGREISRRQPHQIAGLSLMRTFQVPRLFRHMSVLSNLMVAPQHQRGERLLNAFFRRSWKEQEMANLQRARDTIAKFALTDVAQNYASDLSGGQERIAELSRTIMAAPKVLLLDEPFAGVSPTNRLRLADHLSMLSIEMSVTVVMIEHRLEWVERLCKLIYVMAGGRLIAQGSMEDLRKNRQVLEAYLGEPPSAKSNK